MKFEMHNDFAEFLGNGVMLEGRWRILGVSDIGDTCILYDAMDAENGEIVSVREFSPSGICTREDKTLVPLNTPKAAEGFSHGLEAFRHIARGLHHVPHVPDVLSVFDENGTAYIVFRRTEGKRLFEAAPLLTETYAQSLGIMLCDTFAALHRNGIYFGKICEDDLRFLPGGGLTVCTAHLSREGSAADDLHALCAFLHSMLPIERADNPTAAMLDSALRSRYRDAASLRAALLGRKVTRKRRRVNYRGFAGLALCIVFLFGAVIGVRHVISQQQPLTRALRRGKIQPEVISVWLPMRQGADEQAVQAMYERLAAGFERKNPGCGVDIRIFADGSFEDALLLLERGAQSPAVFMDTQDPLVLGQAADLTPLTSVMRDVYITDLNGFGNSLPLGCSIPALYYNTYTGDELSGKEKSIDFSALPAGTLFDVSASDFLELQDAGQSPAEHFSDFLTRADTPVLASSSCMVQAERNGMAAGAVQMMPVSVNGTFPVQYEMYCSISDRVEDNTRQVGLLWLQYLLTEEAQQILFVENYGDLPLHQSAFSSAVSVHTAMKPLRGLEFDTMSLQTRR